MIGFCDRFLLRIRELACSAGVCCANVKDRCEKQGRDDSDRRGMIFPEQCYGSQKRITRLEMVTLKSITYYGGAPDVFLL